MKLGIRSILLIVAIVLFLVAIFADVNTSHYIAGGLAAFAAAFLLSDLPLGRRRGRML